MNTLLKTSGILSSVAKKGVKEGVKYKLNTDKNPIVSGLSQSVGPLKSKPAQAKQQADAVRAHGDKAKAARKGQWTPTMNQKSQNKRASLHPMRQARLKQRASRLDALEKTADPFIDKNDLKGVAKNVAMGTLTGVGMMGAGAAIGAASRAAKKGVNRFKTKKVWNEIKQENPDVANKRGEKLFSVLVDYAPDLATNKEVASSYLQRAQRMQMTPHEFVKDLVNIQSDIDRGSGQDENIQKTLGSGMQAARGVQDFNQRGSQFEAKMAKNSELDDFEAQLDALDPR